ncbi:Uncharacterised protein [Elizabethkingia meningoseptica]|nr:Uncharacterised protein [Elizabethkingia meningoseptica]
MNVNNTYIYFLTQQNILIMKNLKKITRNELKSVIGGQPGFVELGGGNNATGCPKYMHMEESIAYCDPSVNPSDDCKPKCVPD